LIFTMPLAFLLLLLPSVFAQTSTTSSTSASSSTTSSSSSAATSNSLDAASSTTVEPVTRTVSVGYGGYTFKPDVVLANPGDTIEFDFYPANHSVARAAYGYPCVPFELINKNNIGFFSGFEPVDAILNDPPQWSIKVNDSNPIFFYCTAPGSCINYGMVGAINPNATQTLAYQKQLAFKATFMLQPGDSWPSEEEGPSPSSAPSVSSDSATTSSTSAPSAAATTAAATTKHHSSSFSSGAIAGVVVGSVAGLALIGALFYLFGRNRALSDVLGRKQQGQDYHNPDNRQSTLSGTTQVPPQSRHMSNMTMITRPDGEWNLPGSHPGSPGLPQYAHMHHDDRSPSLRGNFDTLSPASPDLPRSPSLGQVPAYTAVPQELPQESRGPHEMPTEQNEWGNDPRKPAGVERFV